MRHNCVKLTYRHDMTLKFCQYFVMEVGRMKDNLSRYTLRVEQELLDKLGYIAEYEGRTKNRELEQMIKKRIRDFEEEHGLIEVE